MIAGWPLHQTILDNMSAAFNTPGIDLFASSIIGRLRIYVSCQSDPDILLIAHLLLTGITLLTVLALSPAFSLPAKNCGRKGSYAYCSLTIYHLGMVHPSFMFTHR